MRHVMRHSHHLIAVVRSIISRRPPQWLRIFNRLTRAQVVLMLHFVTASSLTTAVIGNWR